MASLKWQEWKVQRGSDVELRRCNDGCWDNWFWLQSEVLVSLSLIFGLPKEILFGWLDIIASLTPYNITRVDVIIIIIIVVVVVIIIFNIIINVIIVVVIIIILNSVLQ